MSRGVPIELMKREPLKKIEEVKVKVIDAATREAILKDAANGDSVEKIRKARGLGWQKVKDIVGGSVFTSTNGGSKSRPAKSANGRSAALTPAGDGLYDRIWAGLSNADKKAAVLGLLGVSGL